MPDLTERAFEDAIEQALLVHGPDAAAGDGEEVAEPPFAYNADFFGDGSVPGGYRRRRSAEYSRKLCLIPGDVLSSQPKEWTRLEEPELLPEG